MKNVRTIFFLFAVTTFSVTVGAQTSKSTDDEISLPDVTTVISGDSLTAGKDSVPDFTRVLPGVDTISPTLPELPDIGTETDDKTSSVVSGSSSERTVYAEGLVGGGYPNFFTGDFSVYRTQGENPFRLNFSHESMTGYARNDSSDGFFDSTTKLGGEKTVTDGNLKWNFSGSYKTADNGLQNQSVSFYSMTRQMLSEDIRLNWSLPNDFVFLASLPADWYNRYAGITGTGTYTASEEGLSLFECTPTVRVSRIYKELSVGLSGEFSVEQNVGDADTITGDENTVNRGLMKLDVAWKNDLLRVYGNIGTVGSNALGDNTIIVPFTTGISANFETPFSTRMLVLGAEGGLNSQRETVSELENKYLFTGLSFLPSETSDWYGKMHVDVPVKSLFTVSTSAEYKQTAFGNGVWEPDYDETDTSGIYGFSRVSRTQLDTKAMLTASYGIFTFTADWTSHWMYVPVTEAAQMMGISVSALGKDSRYSADANIKFLVGNDADSVPIVNISAYYRLMPSLRLAIRTDDIVKLISGTSRSYAGTYIARSGSAALLVKFFF